MMLQLQLNKQLQDSEDQRKVLQDQVASLRKQLRDREESLRTASFEIEASGFHLNDLRRLRKPFDDLEIRFAGDGKVKPQLMFLAALTKVETGE